METTVKVSRVEMDRDGRYHCFDGKDNNIFDLYAAEVGDDAAGAELERGDDTGLHPFEERWLRSHGITHVIDREAFGDGEARTIADWRSARCSTTTPRTSQ